MKESATLLAVLLTLHTGAFAQAPPMIDPSLQPNQNNQNNQQNQNTQDDQAGDERYWQATLGGGHYMVGLNRITAVSRHKYVLDGALIVDEVTIDSVGQALARFYFITPISSALPGAAGAQVAESAIGLMDSAARTAGSDLQNMVVKKYPLTTHARTIEYRLLSETQLTSLYNSVRSAWQSGKGRQFTGR